MVVQCTQCGYVCNDSDVRLSPPEFIDNIMQPRESKCTCGAVDSFEPLNDNEDE